MHCVSTVLKNPKRQVALQRRIPSLSTTQKAVPDHKLIRKLLYLAITIRFCIAYTIGMPCQFVENLWPRLILQYLRGTTNMELVYAGFSVPDMLTMLVP